MVGVVTTHALIYSRGRFSRYFGRSMDTQAVARIYIILSWPISISLVTVLIMVITYLITIRLKLVVIGYVTGERFAVYGGLRTAV